LPSLAKARYEDELGQDERRFPPMPYETILYEAKERVATITLNRPEKFNAIRPPMPEELEHAVVEANADREVRVIVLRGAGKAFCAGFDFSENLDHFTEWGGQGAKEPWDPGKDLMLSTSALTAPVPKFMSLWRSPKPVIAQVHGWCVGGGSDLALCADVVIAAEDARLGTPYSRAWGCYLTGMWIYRLGLTRVKLLALTGDSVSGTEAAEIGLINAAVPNARLEGEVGALAQRLARIPVSQLAAMKLIVNQAYENMGLSTTQLLGPILDGYMRHTPEGLAFVKTAAERGVKAAVAERDGPFGDYSQAPRSEKPHEK
jgi:enoyl-CoA hydratase